MENLSPASPHKLSTENDGEIPENSHPCIVKPSELLLFRQTDESVRSAYPCIDDYFNTDKTRHLTLIERREKKLCSASFPSLNAETLHEESRDAIAPNAASPSSVVRGWSLTHHGRTLGPSSFDGIVKIVSYNILAQRLISTDLYPHCPMFALAEDYRCSLLKQELTDAAPDIIMLQEISVDTFEKPGLLGDWLRTKCQFAGDHVVITDLKGRPRFERDDEPFVNANDPYASSETDASSPQMGGERGLQVNTTVSDCSSQLRKRSEMEGVCIFYLKDRFDPCEIIPIQFNKIAATEEQLTQRERRSLQVGSHNVALISVLRDRLKPNMIYVIGTVHLIWQRTECQLWQMHHVLNEMERLKLKYEAEPNGGLKDSCPPQVSLILAGDFNSDVTSPPIRYALTGSPPPGSEVMNYWKIPEEGTNEEAREACSPAHSEKNNGDGEVFGDPQLLLSGGGGRGNLKRYRITGTVGHSLSFSDSYASYREKHPRHVSAVNPSSNGEGGVLDHILVDERHVLCTSVMRLAGRAELPTRDCPSDHYPVGVTILPRVSLE